MSILKKIFEYIKESIKKQSRKKLVENCVIVIIIGIILIIAGGSIFNKKNGKNISNTENKLETQSAAKITGMEEKEEQEKKVESILSKIGGVGNVNVMITYTASKEVVPAYDTKSSDNDTQERDTGGGTRSIKSSDTENKIVYEDTGSGQKKPVILKELQPSVKGVVVVADGAKDPVIKENIARAVQVLLEVPIHRIQVFQGNK